MTNKVHLAADDAEDFSDKFEIIMQLGELSACPINASAHMGNEA